MQGEVKPPEKDTYDWFIEQGYTPDEATKAVRVGKLTPAPGTAKEPTSWNEILTDYRQSIQDNLLTPAEATQDFSFEHGERWRTEFKDRPMPNFEKVGPKPVTLSKYESAVKRGVITQDIADLIERSELTGQLSVSEWNSVIDNYTRMIDSTYDQGIPRSDKESKALRAEATTKKDAAIVKRDSLIQQTERFGQPTAEQLEAQARASGDLKERERLYEQGRALGYWD